MCTLTQAHPLSCSLSLSLSLFYPPSLPSSLYMYMYDHMCMNTNIVQHTTREKERVQTIQSLILSAQWLSTHICTYMAIIIHVTPCICTLYQWHSQGRAYIGPRSYQSQRHSYATPLKLVLFTHTLLCSLVL